MSYTKVNKGGDKVTYSWDSSTNKYRVSKVETNYRSKQADTRPSKVRGRVASEVELVENGDINTTDRIDALTQGGTTGVPVVVRQGETEQEAIRRSAERTAKLYADANRGRAVKVELSAPKRKNVVGEVGSKSFNYYEDIAKESFKNNPNTVKVRVGGYEFTRGEEVSDYKPTRSGEINAAVKPSDVVGRVDYEIETAKTKLLTEYEKLSRQKKSSFLIGAGLLGVGLVEGAVGTAKVAYGVAKYSVNPVQLAIDSYDVGSAVVKNPVIVEDTARAVATAIVTNPAGFIGEIGGSYGVVRLAGAGFKAVSKLSKVEVVGSGKSLTQQVKVTDDVFDSVTFQNVKVRSGGKVFDVESVTSTVTKKDMGSASLQTQKSNLKVVQGKNVYGGFGRGDVVVSKTETGELLVRGDTLQGVKVGEKVYLQQGEFQGVGKVFGDGGSRYTSTIKSSSVYNPDKLISSADDLVYGKGVVVDEVVGVESSSSVKIAEFEAPKTSYYAVGTKSDSINKRGFDFAELKKDGRVGEFIGYSDDSTKIFLDKSLKPKEVKDVLGHEQGHALSYDWYSYADDFKFNEVTDFSKSVGDGGIFSKEFRSLQKKGMVEKESFFKKYDSVDVPEERFAELYKARKLNPEKFDLVAPESAKKMNYFDEPNVVSVSSAEKYENIVYSGAVDSRGGSLLRSAEKGGDFKVNPYDQSYSFDDLTFSYVKPNEAFIFEKSIVKTKADSLPVSSYIEVSDANSVMKLQQGSGGATISVRAKNPSPPVIVAETQAKSVVKNIKVAEATKTSEVVVSSGKTVIPAASLSGKSKYAELVEVTYNKAVALDVESEKVVSPARITATASSVVSGFSSKSSSSLAYTLATGVKSSSLVDSISASEIKTNLKTDVVFVVEQVVEPVVNTPIPPGKFVPVAPVVSLPGVDKPSRASVGYDVYVRKSGVFEKSTVKPLSLSDAKDFGAYRVHNSPRATFLLKPGVSSGLGFIKRNVKGSFSSLSPNFVQKNGMYIEKRNKRIMSPGEKAGITFKGIQSNIIKSKKNKFKKKKGLFGGGLF